MGLYECLLGGVLGLGGGPDDGVSGPEHDLLIAVHDLLVGVNAAALSAYEQLGVVLRPALHRIGTITTAAGRRFRPATAGASLVLRREAMEGVERVFERMV